VPAVRVPPGRGPDAAAHVAGRALIGGRGRTLGSRQAEAGTLVPGSGWDYRTVVALASSAYASLGLRPASWWTLTTVIPALRDRREQVSRRVTSSQLVDV
jgi:hypothetical protein